MITAVADTHVLLWYLFEDIRLSAKVRELIDAEGARTAVSTITVAEMVYLEEKGRIPNNTVTRTLAILETGAPFVLVPFELSNVLTLPLISRTEVPDFPDRLLAATAKSLGVPLLTCDARIRAASAVSTVMVTRPRDALGSQDSKR